MGVNLADLPKAYRTQVEGKLASLGVKIPPRERRDPDAMNSLEKKYGEKLEVQKRVGEIEDYFFQPVKLRLADNTTYTPDFMVITKSRIEFHETKGFMRDDASVKIKVAASIFWFFAFKLVKLEGGGNWKISEF